MRGRPVIVPLSGGFEPVGKLTPQFSAGPFVAEQHSQPSLRNIVGRGAKSCFSLQDAAQIGGDPNLMLNGRISAGENLVLERVGDGPEEAAGVRRVLHVASLPHRVLRSPGSPSSY